MKQWRKISFLITLLIIQNIVVIPPARCDNIVLLSHSGYIDLSGNYHVVGEIQNTGSQTYNLIIVTVDFFDENDEILATRFDLTLLDVILPLRKSPFDIMLLDRSLSSRVDGYAISITQQTRAPLAKSLRIIQHEWYTDEIGNRHITGVIKNEASNPAKDVKVVGTFFDASEVITAASFTYIDADENTLQPGQMVSFEIVLDIERAYYSTSYILTAESTTYSEIKEGEDPPPSPPPPEPDPNPEPANIQVVGLSVTPSEIINGSEMNVIITVENKGSQSGTKTIALEIDSITIDTKQVTLNPGQSTVINFLIIMDYAVGQHEIQVEEQITSIQILLPNLKPPIITAPQPINHAVKIGLTLKNLNFTITDDDSNYLNISATTYPYIGELLTDNVPSGIYSIPIETGLQWNTTYTWTINADDGKHHSNSSYTFTTKEEQLPPKITNEYPLDKTENITKTMLALKFSLDDPNHDRMNYYISISPGEYNTNGLTINEGEQEVLLPLLLVNNTQYKWWLNVTDQEHWTNKSYSFTTYFPRNEAIDTDIPQTIPGDKLIMTVLVVTIIGVGAYLVLTYKQLFLK